MKPCGSVAAFYRHYRAGEPPCDPCREAWNNYYRGQGRTADVGPCPACGEPLKRRGNPRAMHRACHKRAARVEAKRKTRAGRAQTVTVIPSWGVITEGPCSWCGERFTMRHASPAKFCSRQCKVKASKRLRRAREACAPGQFTWTQVMGLFRAFDHRCAYCLAVIEGQPDPDHVVPLSRGGANSIHNILPCCRGCNGDKRNLMLDEWAVDRRRRGLPPVVTSWSQDDPLYAHITSVQPFVTAA